MSQPPTDNPYWAAHYKPHHIDTAEIKSLCLRAFELVMSSQGVATLFDHSQDEAEDTEISASEPEPDDGVYPQLIELHKANVERLLSETLLKLAVLVRTLDDQIADQVGPMVLKSFLDELNGEHGFGTYHEGGEGHLSLRECCNKIIHAADFRPVYDKDGSSQVPGGWAMDGQLELEGRRGNKEWQVTVYAIDMLEGILTFCDALSEKSDTATTSAID